MNAQGELRRHSAFTLVEIMIVVCLIAMLAVIAIPAFVRARATSHRNTCINNLRQIDSAKIQWACCLKKGQGLKPKDSDLFGLGGYIRRKPECPAGGKYDLGKIKDPPSCTQTGHVLD